MLPPVGLGPPKGSTEALECLVHPRGRSGQQGLLGHDAQSSWPRAYPDLMASSVRPQGEPPSEGRPVPGPQTLGCHLGIWGL